MKQKIFEALKQSYSHLGLGDAILTAQADSLASLGFVTEENINAVVEAQKGFLEGLQKSNDKRVTDAVKVAKDTLKKEHEEETRRLEAELKKKNGVVDTKPSKPEPPQKGAEEEPSWMKSLMEKFERKQADSQKAYEELSKKFDGLKADYDGAKAEAQRKARAEFITSTAKKLGIPQYRIDEGFVIADDASEEAVSSTLTTIANNIKTNTLPNDRRFQMSDGAPDKDMVDKVAEALVQKSNI